jgi:hypothetical protein
MQGKSLQNQAVKPTAIEATNRQLKNANTWISWRRMKCTPFDVAQLGASYGFTVATTVQRR